MGKKIAAIKKELDQSKEYSLQDAISIIKKVSLPRLREFFLQRRKK